jgi:hypothetical protein
MDSGFNDPIAPKVKKNKKKSPWNFQAPQRDESTSCFVKAGTNYGMCHKNPVGHEGPAKMRVPTLPFGRIKTQEVDEAPPRILNPDFEE